MSTSGVGIQRSLSPQPRSRSLNAGPSQSLLQDPTSSRQRQHQSAFTPDLTYSAYLQPKYNHRSTPLHHPPYSSPTSNPDQGTLSGVISQLYRSAQRTFSPSAKTGDNSNSPFNGTQSNSPLLSKLSTNSTSSHNSPTTTIPSTTTIAVPSASTVGFILLCCLWYLSSALSSNTGKSILTRFRYPVTLTFVQFAFVAGYSFLVLAIRHQVSRSSAGGGGGGGGLSSSSRGRRPSVNTLQGFGIRKPTKHMFHGTFMMSLFQIAGHVFSSMAIARVPVSTVHTIKALSPLFTVLSYVALFGVRYSTPTYISLFPLTIGVMLACSFDLRANAIGFLCALGSTFIFVAQNIFSKKLLPKESNHGGGIEEKSGGGAGGGGGGGSGNHAKLDKMNLLFYSSGMAFFLMIPIWLYSDASSLFFSPLTPTTTTATTVPDNSTASLLFYFFLNGTVHFAQNLLAFSLLARTSPVTYSIASLVKRIAVICIAIVWFGQRVTPIQGFGMTMTFGGLWMYNQAKGDVARGEKKRNLVEKRQGMELPISLEEARAMDSSDGDDTNTPPTRISQEYNPYKPQQVPPPPQNHHHHHHHVQPVSSTSSTTYENGSSVPRNRQSQSNGNPSHGGIDPYSHHHHQQIPLSSSTSSNSHMINSPPAPSSSTKSTSPHTQPTFPHSQFNSSTSHQPYTNHQHQQQNGFVPNSLSSSQVSTTNGLVGGGGITVNGNVGYR